MKRRFVIISVFCLSAYLLILGCSNPADPDVPENPEHPANPAKQKEPAKQKDPGGKEDPEGEEEPGYVENPDGSVTVTGVKALMTWLADQSDNTETEPYAIKLKGVNLASGDKNNLRGLYAALSRYVVLDLSACTGEKISNISDPGKAKIREIILPLNLITVGKSAFLGCTELTTIDMPGVTIIEHLAFSGCVKLETLHMEKVEAITNTTTGNGAFHQCDSLVSVFLPKATEIGKRTFNSCDSLSSVQLPAVTAIGDSAFASCKSLESLTLGATPPELGKTVFPSKAGAFLVPDVIYVPESALDAYKNIPDKGWDADLEGKVQAQPLAG
ncbi:hypothetical protein AGMMS49942_14880 [Spirochaetia bacterium]|nr:hypothetical protein AGMMS49942_14880 [Spirochaetia bacterium]